MIKKKFKQTLIGEIPEDWEVMKLEDCLELCQYGLSVPLNENGKYPIIRMDEIVNGRVIPEISKYVDIDEKTFKNFKLEKGDILFNRTNSYELIGRTGIFLLDGNYVFASYLIRLRPQKEMLDPQFLTFYLIFSNEKLRQLATRAVHQANINATNLKKIRIPLPPLSEQRKIAEILSTVDNAIQKVSDAIARAERLKKGLMQRLLTKGIGHKRFKFSKELGCEIPEEWEVVRLGDVAKKFIGGGTPATKEPKYWNGNIPWIRSVHINKHYIDISSVEQYITEDGLKNSATNIVPKNNLIIATRVGIGKSAVNLIDVAINQDLTGIILDRSRIIPEFIIWFLYSPKTKKLLESFSRGTTIKGITQTSLRKLNMPLPPLSEQQKIAEILSTVDKKLVLEKERKEKLERIKKGLMNDLLTGRRRVKVEV